MQFAQHLPVPNWQADSISPRPIIMSNRVDQPLTFSIDNRLSEQHLTRLDLSSKNLKKIDKLPNNIHFNVVLLDYNDISKLEHLDILTQLIQLSISHNRLIDIRLLSRLRTLQKLNLSNNSLDSIDCLKTLQNLVMLNISGNNIQNISALNTCHSLQSLDASDNSIRQIEDLSHLTSLKYLNLHKNLIDTLMPASRHWPKSIHTLVISDNEIKDLAEISYLSSLIDLNTFYIHDNPCLAVIDDRYGCYQPFDYRPYVLNWCLTIQNLDGIFITRKESLKAEWLLSQGKGRAYRPGEHIELIQYLTRVCGTDADERDDLHLSRIMLQQDFYRKNDDEEIFLRTSDTMKDANDTLSKDTQSKLQQSLLVSESEFVKISPSSSVGEHDHQKQMRTPSPGYVRPTSVPTNYNDDQITEHSSSNRYSNYDNRPIKPLDKNMLQSKLNQYPVDNHSNSSTRPNDDVSRPRAATNPQQPKRTSSHLAYNANRYSPKTTTRGPTTSTTMHVNMRTKSNKNPTTQQQNQTKRHTIAAGNADTFILSNRPNENGTHRMTSAIKVKHKQQHTSDDDELQLKSAPIKAVLSAQTDRLKTTGKSVELKKLSTSIETTRTSILQAYLDLHERFTKTTELQTSALAALWKMFETQQSTHQHETEKILEENRALNQRLHDLETYLNTNGPKSVKQSNSNLHPPLRAHISKRDAKSFFLHWIPNPLNEQCIILGYRIYIDDIFKESVHPGKFESIIDCILDEGEYKIKLRTYDANGESEDSNVVITRFRRQQPIIPGTDFNENETNIQRTQSDHRMDNISQTKITHTPLRQTQSHDNLIVLPTNEIKPSVIMNKHRERMEVNRSMSSGGFPLLAQPQTEVPTTPDKKTKNSEELMSSVTSSPSHSNSNDNLIHRKPSNSPNSSPSHSEKTTTNNELCTKILFANNSNDSSSTKRSPTRTGIMSRLAKSPHRMKRNNVLLNALPINLTPSPTETDNTNKPEVKSIDLTITSQPELNSNHDHSHFLAEQVPITSSPSRIAPRTSRSTNSLDENSCY